MSQPETSNPSPPSPSKKRFRRMLVILACLLPVSFCYWGSVLYDGWKERKEREKANDDYTAGMAKQLAELERDRPSRAVQLARSQILLPWTKDFRAYDAAIQRFNAAKVTDFVPIVDRTALLVRRKAVENALEKNHAWQKRCATFDQTVGPAIPMMADSEAEQAKLAETFAKYKSEAGLANARVLKSEEMYFDRLAELLRLMESEWGKWYVVEGTAVEFSTPLAAETSQALHEEMAYALKEKAKAREELDRAKSAALNPAKTAGVR